MCISYVRTVGRVSSVGVAAPFQLDGPGIEFRWGEIFRTRPDLPWGPPSLLYNGYRVFPWGKAAGAWRWPPTPSSAEVKERVDLYLYSPSGSSWSLIGWTLPFCPYPVPGSDGSSLRTVQIKTKENIHVLFSIHEGYYFNQRSCAFFHIPYDLSYHDLNVGGTGVSTSNHQRVIEFFLLYCNLFWFGIWALLSVPAKMDLICCSCTCLV